MYDEKLYPTCTHGDVCWLRDFMTLNVMNIQTHEGGHNLVNVVGGIAIQSQSFIIASENMIQRVTHQRTRRWDMSFMLL